MNVLMNLYERSTSLTLFGLTCLIGFFVCLILFFISDVQILGINSWIKPMKFFLSSVIFVWSMAWYLGYLERTSLIISYEWTVIIVLTFELFWITYKASLGELSHFNISSGFNSAMFSLMGVAIGIMTLCTAVIGILFFTRTFPDLPSSYLWGIRLGIILFVIFAFEGGIMGAKLSHTVGAIDGGKGIGFFNWSVSHGDLRIAHFVGMHALQVLPLLGFYLFNSKEAIIITGVFYAVLAIYILVLALKGIPLLSS